MRAHAEALEGGAGGWMAGAVRGRSTAALSRHDSVRGTPPSQGSALDPHAGPRMHSLMKRAQTRADREHTAPTCRLPRGLWRWTLAMRGWSRASGPRRHSRRCSQNSDGGLQSRRSPSRTSSFAPMFNGPAPKRGWPIRPKCVPEVSPRWDSPKGNRFGRRGIKD